MPGPDDDDVVADFGPVLAILAERLPEPPSERPSEATWAAIADELGLDLTPEVADDDDGHAGPDGGRDGGGDGDDGRGGDGTDGDGGTAEPPRSPGTAGLGQPRDWSRTVLVVAAVVAALVVFVALASALR